MHVTPAIPAAALPPVSPPAPSAGLHADTVCRDGTPPRRRAPRSHAHACAPDAAQPVRFAWSEGRGPDPMPSFLVRWHLADGTPCHEPATSDAEAQAFARDARDAAMTEAAVYRLWSILPD